MAPKQRNKLQTKKKYITSDKFVSRIPFFFSCSFFRFFVFVTFLRLLFIAILYHHSFLSPHSPHLPHPQQSTLTHHSSYTFILLPLHPNRHPRALIDIPLILLLPLFHPCLAYPCRQILPAKNNNNKASTTSPANTYIHDVLSSLYLLTLPCPTFLPSNTSSLKNILSYITIYLAVVSSSSDTISTIPSHLPLLPFLRLSIPAAAAAP
ncbi:hypothetical protein K457DRAFT_198717 [Linnemannia elongata AG-77]|uniref:Uncharacterized protein n=1 Tax=Linnemannia elongata AG-77 TaxID=1314771 RepID=A0A197JEW5_9FUNG|nr:hypothetical protein K457DRAFT_198717 [Linnemannia elongata AG-77]